MSERKTSNPRSRTRSRRLRQVLVPLLTLVVSAATLAWAQNNASEKSKLPRRVAENVGEAKVLAQGIQKFYERTQGFSADFVQVVKKRGIKRGLKRKGRVYLKKGSAKTVERKAAAGQGAAVTKELRPGKMRWDYPAEQVYYFSDGDILWTYERRERLAIKLPVRNSRLYQATSYLVGQGELARDFHLAVVPSPLPGTFALKLTPKDGTQVMQSLQLVVDKRTFAVKASILIDPLGDSTTLMFSRPKYHAIADKVFDWSPPKGVTIKTL